MITDEWWYSFFVAGIIGLCIGFFYLIHPAISIGLLGAIGYYIILDRTEERGRILDEKIAEKLSQQSQGKASQ